MIHHDNALLISIVWVYVILGIIFAYFASDEDTMRAVYYGTPRQQLGWVIGNLIVMAIWPVLIAVGVIAGIKRNH